MNNANEAIKECAECGTLTCGEELQTFDGLCEACHENKNWDDEDIN